MFVIGYHLIDDAAHSARIVYKFDFLIDGRNNIFPNKRISDLKEVKTSGQ